MGIWFTIDKVYADYEKKKFNSKLNFAWIMNFMINRLFRKKRLDFKSGLFGFSEIEYLASCYVKHIHLSYDSIS